MLTVGQSWETIEGALRLHAPDVAEHLCGPATSGDIAWLREHFAGQLPADLLESLAIHNGLRDSYLGNVRLFNYNALLPAASIIKASQIERDVQAVYGFDGPTTAIDGAIQTERRWRDGWVPVLDADGDKVVIDLDPGPAGRIGQVIHFYNSDADRRVSATSYAAWLSELADELAGGRFEFDEYGGIWLHSERYF